MQQSGGCGRVTLQKSWREPAPHRALDQSGSAGRTDQIGPLLPPPGLADLGPGRNDHGRDDAIRGVQQQLQPDRSPSRVPGIEELARGMP